MNQTESKAYMDLLQMNCRLVELVLYLARRINHDVGGIQLPDLTDQELTALITGAEALATAEAECPPPIPPVESAPAVPEGMKRCTHCGEVKLLEVFPLNKKARDGRNSWCKACQCADAKRRNAAKKQARQDLAAAEQQPPAVVEPEKTCVQCEESKPLSEFGAYEGTLDRHDFLCSSCRSRTEEKKAARATAGARGAATRRMNARGRS